MNLAIVDDCGERRRLALALVASACAPAIEFRPLPISVLSDGEIDAIQQELANSISRKLDARAISISATNDYYAQPEKPTRPPKEFGMGRVKRWAR